MNWKETLKKYRFASVEVQRLSKHIILPAFKRMWDSKPTESEFCEYSDGLVLFSEMVYYMIEKGVKK